MIRIWLPRNCDRGYTVRKILQFVLTSLTKRPILYGPFYCRNDIGRRAAIFHFIYIFIFLKKLHAMICIEDINSVKVISKRAQYRDEFIVRPFLR